MEDLTVHLFISPQFSSLCLCLIHSISLSLNLISRSLGLVEDAGVSCQVFHLWRICCWYLHWLSEKTEIVVIYWKTDSSTWLQTNLRDLEGREINEGMYDLCWSEFWTLTELLDHMELCVTCVFLYSCYPLPMIRIFYPLVLSIITIWWGNISTTL